MSHYLRRTTTALLCAVLAMLVTGCFRVPLKHYNGPAERPAWIDEKYPFDKPYTVGKDEVILEHRDFTQHRIELNSEYGTTVLDYFKTDLEQEDLILVLPVLGGRKNMIASAFARRFAIENYDTVIVHRDGSFKSPENVDKLEEIFKRNVIRDRLALTYFEKEHGKKNFGSFGISRGGINTAMTAGIDSRLKYNVIVMGGTNLPDVFMESDERRLVKFRNKVQDMKGMEPEELREYLQKLIQTAPRNFAKYIDARDALIILALFDTSVPLEFGRKLRAQMGKPETLYVLAGHRTIALYSQVFKLSPSKDFAIFPLDYVETQALDFFDKKFERCTLRAKWFLFELVHFPFALVERFTRLF